MLTKILFLPILAIGIGLQACGGSDTPVLPESSAPSIPPVVSPPEPITPELSEDQFQAFEPIEYVHIVSGESGLNADLDSGDRFGRDHDRAGDINGDGIPDLVVGARSDDDGATDAGAVYILFMNEDGSVHSNQKISMLEGSFSEILVAGSFFGYGVAGIGDYNGDDIPDIAVSAPSGVVPAIYILHLERSGHVKSMVKNTDIIAQGLSAVGDLNQDGRIDLVAAEPNAKNGGVIHLLFFNQDSKLIVDDIVTIGENMAGFNNGLNNNDTFGGRESALLGDLDNDGTQELAVGAFQSDNGLGAIWILSLDNETHHVVDKLKIAPGLAGFNETIAINSNPNGTTGGHFGHAMVAAGDLNGDGIPDLVTGANQHNNGVGYILYLNADKTIKTFTRLNETEGGFILPLDTDERFSRSMSIVRDYSDDGSITINMGGGAGGTGSIYALKYRACSITPQQQNTFWNEGNTLFSNWSHSTQTVTEPLSFEQCQLKAFEYNGTHITAKAADGRCIIKDESAILLTSDEGSQAYIRQCPE
ncbi:FG-GAP-like repeat-containing protein [Paraglaciecola sp. L3A3]|uniref:FG-GAP-like repeat-containing protein n=1 Tax=Paraglaciecola sp. L3A3 TaxID=2686358 RepID=UPI00131D37B0|nr:FG-GAP-like repeat-containing protein [Paraglaciecola sp. L3A3]